MNDQTGCDKALNNAFTLDSDQRGRGPKRHPHLQARGLPWLVMAALGKHLHAIFVIGAEPPVIAPAHPHIAVGIARVTCGIRGGCAQNHIAGDR